MLLDFFFFTMSKFGSATDPLIIKERINKAFDKLYYMNSIGEYLPYVCVLCDRFLKVDEMKVVKTSQLLDMQDILGPNGWNNVSVEQAKSYKYTGNCDASREEERQLQNMLLSPRAIYVMPLDRRKQ